jgi:lysophospholipase L1-like esterase
VDNVPVPWASYRLPWLVEHRDTLGELSVLRLVRKLRPSPEPQPFPAALPRIMTGIFAELARLNTEKGSSLLLLYLPTKAEHRRAQDDRLPRLVARAAEKLGVAYLDLLEEQKRFSEAETASLYLGKRDTSYPGGAGHFNAKGNAWVAEQVYQRILRLPTVRRHIAAAGRSHAEAPE